MKGNTLAAELRPDSVADSNEAGRIWLGRLGWLLLTLILFGLAVSFSSTVYLNLAQHKPIYADFLDHAKFILLGLAVAWLARTALSAGSESQRWLRFVIPLAYIVSLALVLAVRVTPLGVTIDGAKRWLDLGPVSFQPSELLKISLILYLAQLLCWWRKPALPVDEAGSAERGWGFVEGSFRLMREGPCRWPEMPKRCLPAILIPLGLTALQPDLGSSGVILAVSLMTMALAGVRKRDIAVLLGILALAGTLGILLSPGAYDYAHERLVTWLNPTADPDGDGFQITQSRGAIVSGGLFGRGYLKSEQKINRLPLSTKDFVYPVIVEELGLVGGVAVIVLFASLGFIAIKLGQCCRDPFNQTVVAALGLAIALQAFINIGTTVGTLPVSGITLPFFSGGGTSLVISIFSFGLMAGFARQDLARQARVD